jgi:hypothetical protein
MTLDLNALTDAGVGLVGRIAAVRDGRALFSGGLRNMFSLADLKMQRLLDTFDAWACGCDAARDVGPPERFPATRVPASPRLQLDLRSGEIRAIVWATGFRPVYPWLHVPVVDEKGHLRHDGGSSTAPACTLSACRCSAAGSRRSSTASKTMPGTSSITSPAIWRAVAETTAVPPTEYRSRLGAYREPI